MSTVRPTSPPQEYRDEHRKNHYTTDDLKAYLRGLSDDDMNRLIGWLAVEIDMSPDLEALVTAFRAANDSPNQLPPCEGGDQCPADDGGSRKMSRAGATEDAAALVQHFWEPIASAPMFKTVLTQHADDLYPVAAFKTSDGVWLREMEGPEDLDPPQHGRYKELHRAPTHWMPIPTLQNGKEGA